MSEIESSAAPVRGSPIASGEPGNIARDGDDLRFTVIPLPTHPSPDVTMNRRKSAISITYTGRIQEAIDLYRGTIEADGWMVGILDTIAHGLLGCPQQFQGDPELVSALTDSYGTPGDDSLMHPETECAKVFRDGLGFGLGLGQYLLSCWRCGSVEWDRVRGELRDYEICKLCDADRLARPVGTREIFSLQWRDPRWIYQNPVTRQWYFSGRNGLIAFRPGDGEWFMFETVPGMEPWRHGPWVWGTSAAIFSRDAVFDRQNISAVCAPTPVLKATKPTTPQQRKEAEERARKLGFDNKLVLDGSWDYDIVSATGEYVEVCDNIVQWSAGMFEVGLTGNLMGLQAKSAFTDANVYQRVTRERRAFYATAWARQKWQQGLTWWSLDNYGHRRAPRPYYNTKAPEDVLAEAKALGEWGDGFTRLQSGLGALGLEADPQWAIETMQRAGVRARLKPAGAAPASKLEFAPTDLINFVKVNEARASQGLGPLPEPYGSMTIAAYLADQEQAAAQGQKSRRGVRARETYAAILAYIAAHTAAPIARGPRRRSRR